MGRDPLETGKEQQEQAKENQGQAKEKQAPDNQGQAKEKQAPDNQGPGKGQREQAPEPSDEERRQTGGGAPGAEGTSRKAERVTPRKLAEQAVKRRHSERGE